MLTVQIKNIFLRCDQICLFYYVENLIQKISISKFFQTFGNFGTIWKVGSAIFFI